MEMVNTKQQRKKEKKKEREKKLEELKKKYEKFKIKYDLPDFDELNKEFEIERAANIKTEYLLRVIRRLMSDKFIYYTNLFDNIMNAQRIFTMLIAKKIDVEKDMIYEFMKRAAKITMKEMETELHYDEKNEAEEIKFLYNEWKKMKKDIEKIVKSLSKKINKEEKEIKKEESKYFG